MTGHLKTLCGCERYMPMLFRLKRELMLPINLGLKPNASGWFENGTEYSTRRFVLVSVDMENAVAHYVERSDTSRKNMDRIFVLEFSDKEYPDAWELSGTYP